jgi:hypothetical protein
MHAEPNAETHPLLVLFGRSGSGKTSVMAKAARAAADTRGERVFLMRFLGTSADTGDAVSLVRNLCETLTVAYGQPQDPHLAACHDLDVLAAKFENCFLQFPSESQPLVVFLDSLDQLSAAQDGRQLKWLPKQVPRHVSLVVSTISDEGEDECYRALRASDQLPETNFVEIELLDQATSGAILDAWLEAAKRTLSDEQRRAVLKSVGDQSLALHLKLCFDQAKTWHSFEEIELGADMASVIDCIFSLAEVIEHAPS